MHGNLLLFSLYSKIIIWPHQSIRCRYKDATSESGYTGIVIMMWWVQRVKVEKLQPKGGLNAHDRNLKYQVHKSIPSCIWGVRSSPAKGSKSFLKWVWKCAICTIKHRTYWTISRSNKKLFKPFCRWTSHIFITTSKHILSV